jgi:prepilin-type N-terminal cleavage/methylation domain-containing protein
MNKKYFSGFTLIELMVTVAIIALLSAVLFANFNDARMQARDKARMASLKEMQLSIELYKAQYGRYPAAGCSAASFAGPGPAGATGYSSCADYVTGHVAGATFVPDFISTLPQDPRFENEAGRGFYYRTDTNGTEYKLMMLDSVESGLVTDFGDEFARCPAIGGGCTTLSAIGNTYSVYSGGVNARTW